MSTGWYDETPARVTVQGETRSFTVSWEYDPTEPHVVGLKFYEPEVDDNVWVFDRQLLIDALNGITPAFVSHAWITVYSIGRQVRVLLNNGDVAALAVVSHNTAAEFLAHTLTLVPADYTVPDDVIEAELARILEGAS